VVRAIHRETESVLRRRGAALSAGAERRAVDLAGGDQVADRRACAAPSASGWRPAPQARAVLAAAVIGRAFDNALVAPPASCQAQRCSMH
jgi:hypothetical protein